MAYHAVNCLLFQKPHLLRQLGRLDKTMAVMIDNVRCDNIKFYSFFGRPFVKRFALCYRTVVLSVMLVYCFQTAGQIKMKLGLQVGLGPGHIVLDGDPAPPPPQTGGTAPQFSAHVYCGQTAGCIRIPQGMEAEPDLV